MVELSSPLKPSETHPGHPVMVRPIAQSSYTHPANEDTGRLTRYVDSLDRSSAWGALHFSPEAFARARTLPNGIVEVNISDDYRGAWPRSPMQELIDESIREMERNQVEDLREDMAYRRRERERLRTQREEPWDGSNSRPIDSFYRNFTNPEWLKEWNKMDLESQNSLLALVYQTQMLYDMEVFNRTFGMMMFFNSFNQ